MLLFVPRVLLFILSTGFSADVSFDDSYAWSLCGGNERPSEPIIVALCSEMMAVGQWYTKEVERLGVKNGVDQIKPTHMHYPEVRKLGMEVDLRAQELMVLMARSKCQGSDGKGDKASCSKLQQLEIILKEMRINANNMDMVDAISNKIEKTDREMSRDKDMKQYDPESLLRESREAGVSVSELVSRKRSYEFRPQRKKNERRRNTKKVNTKSPKKAMWRGESEAL